MFVRELEVHWGKQTNFEIGHKNMTDAESLIEVARSAFGSMVDGPKEHFYVIGLDIRNKVTGWQEVSRGSISASVVDPADVMRFAILSSSSRVVLVHNHPSGEYEPSKEDIDTTNKIVMALKYITVRVLDHIIISDDPNPSAYFSFSRAGMV